MAQIHDFHTCTGTTDGLRWDVYRWDDGSVTIQCWHPRAPIHFEGDLALMIWNAILDSVDGRYYKVLVPFQAPGLANEWTPTESTGPSRVLSRGSFDSQTEAHYWARCNLRQGAAYSVVAY